MDQHVFWTGMHCFYENRMSYIIPRINYDEEGFERFKELWCEYVGEQFCTVGKAFYEIICNFGPPGQER